jgi:hypothetical protein
VLREPPAYGVTGGEFNHDFVDFKLTGGKKFRLTGCACNSTRKSIVTNLVRGDTLRIRATSTLFDRGAYNVYSIRSPQRGSILEIHTIRYCARQMTWVLVVLGGIAGMAGVITLIIQRREDREEQARLNGTRESPT